MKNSNTIIVISVICNIFLCIIKTIIGILSNSQALIADGIHSLEDVSSSVISLIGNKIASNNNNRIYPFGIKRVKYVFSLTVSILMIMISITMLKNVISSLVLPSEYVFNFYSLIVCFITIIVKLILYIYSKYEYKNSKNILVKSIMCDHKNDIVITIGVILSIVLTKYELYILDYIAGFVISILIGYTGIKIYLESYNILMCKKVDELKINQIFGNNIDIINMGESYIVILNIKQKENSDNDIIYDKAFLEKYNISLVLVRYM